MKNVMTRAWKIAREGAAKFGGKVKEYFAEALRMAWAEIKKGANKVAEYPKVVKMRAEQLLETGDQPEMRYAMGRAEMEFSILIQSVKKINAYKESKGEQAPSIEMFKQMLDNVDVKQYIHVMQQLNYTAKNLPKF